MVGTAGRGTKSLANEVEFTRLFKLRHLPAAGGHSFVLESTPDERRAIARRLDLVTLAEFAFQGRIEKGPRDGILIVRGTIEADLTQRCVVTLEPVPARLEVPVERYFIIDGDVAKGEIVVSPDDEEPEPIDGDLLDLGEIAVEELSLALDPYPHAADAPAVLRSYNDAADAAARSAFAALAALRDRSKRR
jgi:uncharacterized metal-binding protein YceD (DUF177 family)